MSKNPKLRKNGGKGTLVGNLLRGIVSIGKTVSPQLKSLLDVFDGGEASSSSITSQLAKEGFDENELKFLLGEFDRDKSEMEEITKRWEADTLSGSWLSRNVRPITLVLYNVTTLLFIYMDSKYPDFNVKNMWINLLIGNTSTINVAYFGSKYMEKRDAKKYK
tara:strand:+ start:12777 stop:13265 length:489 start_codon:yes stop_codon:yes gene_type:complete